MTEKRETAPVRAVASGLLGLAFGYATVAVNASGRISLAAGRGITRADFAISRFEDGWQFDLTVLLLGLVALACAAVCASAVRDFFASEGEGA